MAPGTRGWETRLVDPSHHRYTDEDWQQIFDTWAKEDYRGDKPLYWEDVNVGDMPNITIDGPIHASCNPTPPYGMAVGGSRTMKELADPEVRAKMTRDPKYGVYVPADMKEWDPEVPPYDDPRAKMGPPPGAGAPPKEEKRSIFINFLGRDFAIHHINNWMGTHGWIQNIRWGIMTNPTEQGFCFPKNTAVCE